MSIPNVRGANIFLDTGGTSQTLHLILDINFYGLFLFFVSCLWRVGRFAWLLRAAAATTTVGGDCNGKVNESWWFDSEVGIRQYRRAREDKKIVDYTIQRLSLNMCSPFGLISY